MAQWILLDEFHLTVWISKKLDDSQQEKIRKKLAHNSTMNSLKKAIESVFEGKEFQGTKIKISQ